MNITVQVLAAGLLGAGVSYTRLTKHFPDAPLKAALTPPGGFYLAINALISWLALLLVTAAGWRFGLSGDTSDMRLGLTRVIAAGLGAPLLLQSSLASVRIGDLNLDPGSFVNSLLEQGRQAVDRHRAAHRLTQFYLHDLVFDQHCVPLTELLSNALQVRDLDSGQAAEFGERMGQLSARTDLPGTVKLHLLQFELVNRAGDKAVRAAAHCLRRLSDTENGPDKGQPEHGRVRGGPSGGEPKADQRIDIDDPVKNPAR